MTYYTPTETTLLKKLQDTLSHQPTSTNDTLTLSLTRREIVTLQLSLVQVSENREAALTELANHHDHNNDYGPDDAHTRGRREEDPNFTDLHPSG